jgi:hypothetical protein
MVDLPTDIKSRKFDPRALLAVRNAESVDEILEYVFTSSTDPRGKVKLQEGERINSAVGSMYTAATSIETMFDMIRNYGVSYIEGAAPMHAASGPVPDDISRYTCDN